MPVYQRGGPGKQHVLSTADCKDWVVERARKDYRGGKTAEKPTDDTKSQINNIKLQRAQIELDERRGDLFHFSQLGPFIKDKLVNFRNAGMAVADRLRERFGPEVGKVAKAEITAMLNELSRDTEEIPDEIRQS